MTRKRSWFLVAAGLLAVSAVAAGQATGAAAPEGKPSDSPRRAATYQYVDLGVLYPDGPQHSKGKDVNASGRAAGWTTGPGKANNRAFSWADGKMTDLGAFLDDAYASTWGTGINDSGEVVGYAHVTGDEPPHAFLHTGSELRDLGTGYGKGGQSAANDINDNGDVVGEHGPTQSTPKTAALWKDSEVIDLGTLGGSSPPGSYGIDSEAYALNNKGQVVGVALPEEQPRHAFLWENGSMKDLGTLGYEGELTEARDINDQGQIVGSSPLEQTVRHAVTWEDGKIRDLGALFDSGTSWAYGINEKGQIVGSSDFQNQPSDSAGHAVIWDNAGPVDLNTVTEGIPDNVSLERAEAINDEGVIVGSTCTPRIPSPCEGGNQPQRGFLLIPRP